MIIARRPPSSLNNTYFILVSVFKSFRETSENCVHLLLSKVCSRTNLIAFVFYSLFSDKCTFRLITTEITLHIDICISAEEISSIDLHIRDAAGRYLKHFKSIIVVHRPVVIFQFFTFFFFDLRKCINFLFSHFLDFLLLLQSSFALVIETGFSVETTTKLIYQFH